ncbi:tetratricopeptide repeat protein [Dethiobacter alkaliphilus]|uniref:tetratricopeptide repeat protein n=1 Tax=Dethiobacter alkaliphilus TaxID=427926 RepID=UPI002227F5D2|nr:tetratricopeptide repeat protein [Dethiobacter alkaliphilus]MCW3491710.1 tetratricopeptide repeat protein [Dethiobacter alkaliphilus]
MLKRLQYDSLNKIKSIILFFLKSDYSKELLIILSKIEDKKQQLEKNLPLLCKDENQTKLPDLAQKIFKPYYGREQVVNNLRRFINNKSSKICFIFGMRGIGKTSLLTEAINSIYPLNWHKHYIYITEGTGFPRFFLSLCESIGFNVSEEKIDRLVPEQLEALLYRFFKEYDKVRRSCIIIDDWHYTLLKQGYRDVRFYFFLKIAGSRPGDNFNKVFVASQKRCSVFGANSLVLNPLDNESIYAIIDWHIKSLYGDSKSIDIPSELINKLHGNPLAAEIVSQLLDKFPVNELLNDITVQERFQDRLIPILLEKIELNEAEVNFINYLSVFNMPFPYDIIDHYIGEESANLIESLMDHFLLEYDIETGLYQIHPLIKDFYYNRIPKEQKIKYHNIIADYYEVKVETNVSSPVDKGEFISHLAHSMQFERAMNLRFFYIDELRPVAKRLYKGRDYKNALSTYLVLNKFIDKDLDILFHIGLCYANLDKWQDAEKYINESLELDPKAWWVLAGYGHVLVKKYNLAPAEKYLNHALEVMDQGKVAKWRYSAIYQSLAMVFERFNLPKSENYYKKAIEYDEESAFAHYHYAKYLAKNGNYPQALQHLQTANKLDASLKQIDILRTRILEESKDFSDIDQSYYDETNDEEF